MVVFMLVVGVLALVAGGSLGSKAADMAPSAASDLRNGVLAVAGVGGLVLGALAGFIAGSFFAYLILTPVVVAGLTYGGLLAGEKLLGGK